MSYYRQGPVRPIGGGGIGIGVPSVTPWVKYLIIANVAVWLVQIALVYFLGFFLSEIFGVVPRRVLMGWVWQPFTYMFLHNPGGPGHLLLNMLMLWMFGSELERYWGSRAFLRFYLACGVGGGIAVVLAGAWTASAWVPTIGASGALFGLFVAYGVVFAERVILFMLIFPMKARTMAIVMAAINLAYLVTQPGSGVSYVAHLGGGLTGYLYLKRAWRVGELYREVRWKLRRRRFRVMPPDDDRWVN
jgi:membrane associated rhomboid family serine protease